MKNFSEKHNITFTGFSGEPGHGQGLVGAKSSFGSKSPFRYAILNDDKSFQNAEEMTK